MFLAKGLRQRKETLIWEHCKDKRFFQVILLECLTKGTTQNMPKNAVHSLCSTTTGHLQTLDPKSRRQGSKRAK